MSDDEQFKGDQPPKNDHGVSSFRHTLVDRRSTRYQGLDAAGWKARAADDRARLEAADRDAVALEHEIAELRRQRKILRLNLQRLGALASESARAAERLS